MTSEQYDILLAQCAPHPVFSSDWLTFTDAEFADALLPDAGLVKGTNLYFFDGAELLPKGCRFPKRLMRLPDGKAPLLAMYSYPKGVKAAQRRGRVQPQDNELLLFAEIDRSGKVDVYMDAGESVEKTIKQLCELQDDAPTAIAWGKAIKTSEKEFMGYFEDEFSHYRVLQYAGTLLGIDLMAENDTLSSYLFKKVAWIRRDGSLVNGKSDMHYGEKVKLSLTVRDGIDLKNIKVTIGIWDRKSESIDRNKKTVFTIANDKGKYETPFFSIPVGWYNDVVEKYDYEKHYTKVAETDTSELAVRIDISYFKVVLKERLVPTTYHRNYEELIGLTDLNNGGVCEVYYINKNYEIEGLVNDFVSFMKSERAESIGAISERVKKDARMLWELAVQQCESTEKSDDRPLYWARLKMQVALKRNPIFKEQIDMLKSIVVKGTELDGIVNMFENLSRNYTGIDFSQAPDGCKKVLLMGFDPFMLNKHLYLENPETFNPSGLLALQLHGKTIKQVADPKKGQEEKKLAYVQTCIFPVKYEDFDNGVVEEVMKRYAEVADVIISSSRNDMNWDIEEWAISYRGGRHDNMFVGDNNGENPKPDKDRYSGIYIKEFFETSLPKDKILCENTINGKRIRYDIKRTETEGSGGNYLSNEIMYRITKYREEKNMKEKPVGHIHIGLYKKIEENNIAKEIMEEIIRRICK